ncbi:MAG: peptidase M20, partial [Clostridia bacterium]|nr:peptidase M20 [Clostridia bacterium]
MIAVYVVLALIVVLLAVLILRTLTFKPKAQNIPPREEVEFDREAAIHALAELVRCKTVSYYEHEKEDDAEFE